MSAARRVLVVDDAQLVRLYYRDALTRAGYAVEEALNGLEALEKTLAPERTPDLLIVDVNMPRMDGLSFLRALRRQGGPIAGTPALITSSEAADLDRAAARAAGANFYLVKPVAQPLLVRHVRLLCGEAA